jgi:hypothetical protein
VFAQSTLDNPVGQTLPYDLDTGPIVNAGNQMKAMFQGQVHIEGAAWVRLHFDEPDLQATSYVQITNPFDGEVQQLDRHDLAMWSDTSGYFNGDTLKIEVFAAPRTTNRVRVSGVEAEVPNVETGGCAWPCGICNTDNRVPSSETFVARLSTGCSATIYNANSCAVSAGHCMGGSMVLLFNVPASNANCSLNQPPIADQFPVITFDSENAGIANDWAVMTSGTNSLGQTAFERYGELRPISGNTPFAGQQLTIWGFGIDSECTRSQAQQTSSGAVDSVSSGHFRHTVDATCGNSGSSIIQANAILGIASHCPCPNYATRVDVADFAAARASLCPDEPCDPPNCNDGDVCTDDVCIGGACQHTNNNALCTDFDMCTIGDTCNQGRCNPGAPVDCSGASGECFAASCDAAGFNGNCDTLTPTNEGGSCNSGAGVCVDGDCVVDPGGPRTYIVAAGQEEAADSPTTNIHMFPGETRKLEVWANRVDSGLIGGYQIALPAAAQRASGSGTTTYVDTPLGSIAIDEAHPAWIFRDQPDVSTFLSETGLPDGVALIATLPIGTGTAADEFAYFGELEVSATIDACGEFSLSFLPDGAPPNGGSAVVDESGVGSVAAFFQPLQIDVGAPNDLCANATSVLGDSVAVDFDTTCATSSGLTHGCGTIENDIWYDYFATCTGTLSADTSTGCSYDTAIALYAGSVCPIDDGDLLQCADSISGCEEASTAVAIGDRVLIRVGSIAGAAGSGTLTLTCTPVAETTRVFMVPTGAEVGAPTTGPTSMNLATNQIATVEVWAADTSPEALGSYQIGIAGRAQSNGAHGTVVYRDDTVTVDDSDADFVFSGLPAEHFLTDLGLPTGFGMISTLPLGQGTAVSGLAYLGEFQIKASSTALGSFTLNFLPTGAPPNGGSALVDTTGTGPINATFQPLIINVVPALPCSEAADCADLDSNGITDDACRWFECSVSACNSQPRVFGDLGGPFGACPIDGFANVHDTNHVLNCFAGLNTCDSINIDAGGAFGDCAADGFCNVHDVNHVLQAFAGLTTCSCPLDGGPAPEFTPPGSSRAAATTSLRLVPRRAADRQDGVFEVDVFLTDALDDLLSLQISLNAPKTVVLEDIRIDVRKDAVFAGRSDAYVAFNAGSERMMAGLTGAAMATSSDAYIATFSYRATRSARGTVVIDVDQSVHTAIVGGDFAPIVLMDVQPATILLNNRQD